MKDRILLDNGQSNNVKMDLTNISTFNDFKTAAEAGTLTADVVASDQGVYQAGTPLTAENLLTDETASAMGLASDDPTVEEVFALFAQRNEGLVWNGMQNVFGTYNEEDPDALFVIGNGDSDSERSNAWTVSQGGDTSQSGSAFYEINKGVNLTDSTGYTYPGIFNNSSNMWIGARQTAAQHHTGGTYISSGYSTSASAGFQSVYISVPNATNTGATNYLVYHAGYKPVGFVQQSYPNVAITTKSAGGAYYSPDLAIPSAIPSGATIIGVTVANFTGAAASYTACYNGTRLFVFSDVSQTVTSVALRIAYIR